VEAAIWGMYALQLTTLLALVGFHLQLSGRIDRLAEAMTGLASEVEGLRVEFREHMRYYHEEGKA
jgi:hypothetical protein